MPGRLRRGGRSYNRRRQQLEFMVARKGGEQWKNRSRFISTISTKDMFRHAPFHASGRFGAEPLNCMPPRQGQSRIIELQQGIVVLTCTLLHFCVAGGQSHHEFDIWPFPLSPEAGKRHAAFASVGLLGHLTYSRFRVVCAFVLSLARRC